MKTAHVLTSVTRVLLQAILVTFILTACDREEESHEDIVKADLSIIIDALGSPCGQVLSYESTKELGYTVHCKTGDVYIISVNPQGRVDIQDRE